MRKLTLYISISLDGYIAEINGGLEWLENFPNPKETDYGYQEFYEKVDTLIMGGKTYRHILDMCDKWPYPEKNTYIISHQPIESNKRGIHYLGENWLEEIKFIKDQKGQDIWLVGGGEIASEMLNAGLIDTMIITEFPVLLGNGIPLYNPPFKKSHWSILRGRYYINGVTQTEYGLKKE